MLSGISRNCFIVADTSTVRRHLASTHAPEYSKWCEKVGFESRLPEDVKERKLAADAADAAAKQLHQQTLEPHLREKPEHIVPYADELWRTAALEWLIATDQPIAALNHPKFKSMIDIAARATNGVKIPGRHATREEIIKLFHNQMDKLRIRLHVRQILITSSSITDVFHRVMPFLARYM
ncbi:hypothetical protein DFH08DRAFT_715757 [Mycena albidolilacea]|uniref:Uncharacterized protein n=1 Tax=Mycena albidolilacea TaxID=1033008 RepID=A0AAD6ZBT0_9AGAR|nr:hypothetical protein DFH08DRAFT_715757 [Mycena albidolilacea]